MAVATSLTSARVGVGEVTIDSSICVATTTGLPYWRAVATILFCSGGTCSGGSSTPRSPRSGGGRRGHHRFQHLRRAHHRLAVLAGGRNDLVLQWRHLLGRELDPEVAEIGGGSARSPSIPASASRPPPACRTGGRSQRSCSAVEAPARAGARPRGRRERPS